MGFLFVVSCDTAKVVFVSDSVLPVLGHLQTEWLGCPLHDLVHPDDADKITEQLATHENAQTARVLDLKSECLGKSI